MRNKIRKTSLAFVIAFFLASVFISPNFFLEKSKDRQVQAFAPAVGIVPVLAGGGSLAVAPVAIGLGVAVAAVGLGIGVGEYIKNADQVNATVVDAWNNATDETKKIWVGAAKDFINKAKKGEKVVDAAGNYVMSVPRELTKILTKKAAEPNKNDIAKKMGLKSSDIKEFSDLVNMPLVMMPNGVNLTKMGYTIIFQRRDGLWSELRDTHSDQLITIDQIDRFMSDEEHKKYNTAWALQARMYDYMIQGSRRLGYLVNMHYDDIYPPNHSKIYDEAKFKKLIKLASANPPIDDRAAPKIVPAEDIDPWKLAEKFTNAYVGNYKKADDNARKLLDGGTIAVPAPLCKIPRAFATGDNGKLSHDIVWDGNITSPNGDKIGGWVDGGKSLTGSGLDSLGNLDIDVPGSGTQTLNPGLTWTIPKVDDWAYNPGYVDTGVKDKPIDLVNKGLGTNVLDDAKPIDDAIALNPPTALPKPPAGAVNPPAGGDTIHWENLTDLGKHFTKVFPFCIPFDVGEYVAGSVNNLERKEFKKYEVPIYKNYKVTLTIPHEFYNIGNIIRSILLVLYDVGLMYAVYKWFSALK